MAPPSVAADHQALHRSIATVAEVLLVIDYYYLARWVIEIFSDFAAN
jgi:hypothetical protein